jgi:hypothetical protein
MDREGFMDHQYIEANNIVARYEMGKLSAAERASFEEHFVDCPQCQEQLETTTDFRQALRTVARQDNWAERRHPPTTRTSFTVARLAMAGAAAALAAGAVSLVLLMQRVHRVENELAQSKTRAEEWHNKYESEHQTADALAKQLQQTQETTEGSGPEKFPVLASVFVLNRVRGVDSGNAEPANWVVVPHQPQWIVLSIDRDRAERYGAYRVTLTESAGRALWKKTVVDPKPGATLSVSLPAKLLPPGDYTLSVEGLTPDGAFVASGRYTFRVKYKP